MLFDVINDLHIPEGSDGAEVDSVSHYRTEHLYKQFLALLNKEDGRVRLVSYYADKALYHAQVSVEDHQYL